MNKPLPVFRDTPPTDDFEAAFSDHCGGCVRDCACGRTLFDVENSYDWETGELEHLEKMAKEKPLQYIALPYSVSTMSIGGEEWVMGCPCNGGRKFQDFIDHHAEQIAQYLNKRAERLRQMADSSTVKP